MTAREMRGGGVGGGGRLGFENPTQFRYRGPLMPDWGLVGNLLNTVASGTAGAFIHRWLERRPSLLAYFLHTSWFKMNEQLTFHTHSIVVRNAGGRAATNIRIQHDILPDYINVYPPTTRHEITPLGHGGEILFPTLVPKEQVTIGYLYFPPLTWNQIHAGKHDEGFARPIEVLTARRYPMWFNLTAIALAGIGALVVL